MHRLTRTSRLIAALLALAMILPTAAFAGECCCMMQAQDEHVACETADAQPPSCCAAKAAPTPAESDDEQPEPDHEKHPCTDCNCPGQCCTSAKTPIDTTPIESALRFADATDHARPTADRFDDDGAAFELIHPPRA